MYVLKKCICWWIRNEHKHSVRKKTWRWHFKAWVERVRKTIIRKDLRFSQLYRLSKLSFHCAFVCVLWIFLCMLLESEEYLFQISSKHGGNKNGVWEQVPCCSYVIPCSLQSWRYLHPSPNLPAILCESLAPCQKFHNEFVA